MCEQNKYSITIENKIIKGPELFLGSTKNVNIGEKILNILKENAEFVGLIDGRTGETCTYGKLADASMRCALWLKKQNISTGDVISIWSDNSIMSWALLYAVWYIGRIVSPWDQNMSSTVTRRYLNLVKPKVVFTSEQCAKEIRDMLEEDNIESKIVVFNKVPGFESLDDVLNEASLEQLEKFECSSVNSDDDAVIVFSSRNTVITKCALFSSEAWCKIIFHSINCFCYNKNGIIASRESSICWISGLVSTCTSILTISPAIITIKSSVEELCGMIEKYKIEVLFIMSNRFIVFSKSEALTKFNLSSLHSIHTTGGHVNRNNFECIKRILPNCDIFHHYGATECGVAVATKIFDNKNADSAYIPCPNVEIKFMNNNRQALEPRQVGEICVKRDFMMKEYYKNPTATEEAIDSDGWYHTGDIGHYDEEGNIYIIEIMEIMIKYKSELVSPSEIENILLQHPGVKSAAVVALPNSIDGEHPIAFVVKDKHSKVTEEELVQLSSALGESKLLRGGVVFIEEMPQTAAQKLSRLELQRIAITKDFSAMTMPHN